MLGANTYFLSKRANKYFYRTPLYKQLEQMTMENMSVEALLACVFVRIRKILHDISYQDACRTN